MKRTGRSCLCFLALTAKASLAQVANDTSLVGNVADATGRTAVGVRVRAFHAAIYSTKTNEGGAYSISQHTVRTDVSLHVGSVAEPMVVNAGRTGCHGYAKLVF